LEFSRTVERLLSRRRKNVRCLAILLFHPSSYDDIPQKDRQCEPVLLTKSRVSQPLSKLFILLGLCPRSLHLAVECRNFESCLAVRTVVSTLVVTRTTGATTAAVRHCQRGILAGKDSLVCSGITIRGLISKDESFC
jgi:hypothetical protein